MNYVIILGTIWIVKTNDKTMSGIYLIECPEQFKLNFYYKGQIREEDYPIEYPCILDKIQMSGGLGGDFVYHKIVYFPDSPISNTESKKLAYFEGYKAGRAVNEDRPF